MNTNLSERNRKVAINRWKSVRKKYVAHLNSIRGDEKYYLYTARLLGYLAGDGYVNIREEQGIKHYHIKFYPDNKEMIDAYTDAFEFLYLEKPHVIKLKNHWEVRICHMVACKDILRRGSIGTYDWRVPHSELRSFGAVCEWLRAFFDAEAYVNHKYIRVESVNKQGLQDVKNLLELVGIKSSWYVYERKNENHNTNYILCILDSKSRHNFEKYIGFFHSRKRKALRKLNAAGRI